MFAMGLGSALIGPAVGVFSLAVLADVTSGRMATFQSYHLLWVAVLLGVMYFGTFAFFEGTLLAWAFLKEPDRLSRPWFGARWGGGMGALTPFYACLLVVVLDWRASGLRSLWGRNAPPLRWDFWLTYAGCGLVAGAVTGHMLQYVLRSWMLSPREGQRG